MQGTSGEGYDGEIVEFLRSRCIGFQRGEHGLITVIESLVRPRDGPPTVIYQLRSADGHDDAILRSRPRIDIPAPSQSIW